MTLPQTDDEWRLYLAQRHDAELPELRRFDDEYQLRTRHHFMHPDVARELGGRVHQVVMGWSQLVVDSLEERLDVEGFRLPDKDAGEPELWRVWQENNCDEESQLAHVDALAMRRAYVAVGANEDDESTPLVTFESPLEVYADIDPRTRKVRAGLRRWREYDASLVRLPERYETLYLPDATIYYEATGGGEYKVVDRDDHKLGVVPLVPLVNRSRLADRRGRSELEPILPLVHAADKLATDMMVAAEFVAIPLRGFFGIGPDAFEDEHGNKLTALQAILGRMLAIPDDANAVKQFEFAAAQLSNFHDAILVLAQLVATVAALPPYYLAITTQNPASADAIRSSESRLIKRAERKQRSFGGAHEQVMRLVQRIRDGDWDPRYRRLETIWRDPSTPTVAQAADAAVKLYNIPMQQPIVPLRQTRESLGFSQAQIARMEAEDQKARSLDIAPGSPFDTDETPGGPPPELTGAAAGA